MGYTELHVCDLDSLGKVISARLSVTVTSVVDIWFGTQCNQHAVGNRLNYFSSRQGQGGRTTGGLLQLYNTHTTKY